jgi:hypothetical protein
MFAAFPHLLVLEGQGTSALLSDQTADQALQDASSPMGKTLLDSCSQAFVLELQSLSQAQADEVPQLREAFLEGDASLLKPPQELIQHPIVANVRICLVQLLRYLSAIGGASELGTAIERFSLGVAGFSSGIVAAVVIAGSKTASDYLFYACQAVRLSFWIGLRSLLAIGSALDEKPKWGSDSASWSLVLFGCKRDMVLAAADKFNQEHVSLRVRLANIADAEDCQSKGLGLSLSAALTNHCMLISGPPDLLDHFQKSYLPETCSSTQRSSVSALYHSAWLRDSVAAVVDDVRRRRIALPSYEDLVLSLRSSINGRPLKGDADLTLVEALVSMVLVDPANFDVLPAQICAELHEINGSSPITVANIGPGQAVSRSLCRGLSAQVARDATVNVVDWSFVRKSASAEAPASQIPKIPSSGLSTPARESIAIVGMAVNLPQAKNTASLWSLLERGINTISEVRGPL